MKRVILFLLPLALVIGIIFFDFKSWLESGLKWVEQLGPTGAVIFVIFYALAAVFLIPASLLTIGAGTLFGVVYGSALVSLASTLGAALCFLIGRYLARDAIAAKVKTHEKFAALDQAIAKEGWKIVALTRLSPIFPYTFLNYAFGLTRVNFWPYVIASWLAMLPGTVMYVYLGSLVRLGTDGPERSTWQWVMYGVGLVATISVTVFMTGLAKKALDGKSLATPAP